MKQLLDNIKGDRAIWLLMLILALFSILVVYSSISSLAYKYQQGNTMYYLGRHTFFLLIGFGLMYVTHRIKYTYFSRISQLLMLVSIPLLLLTLLVGSNINSASRWLVIPIINQSFQTSDLAKVGLIMYVARALAIRQDSIKDFSSSFLPIIIPIFIIIGLILPANFSTAAVLFTACLILMFIGRISMKYIFGLIATGILLLSFGLLLAKVYPGLLPRADTWVKRIESFRSGESGDNFQVEQSKIAIATGGITGKGPGKSTQRNILPHPYSDFIYAIILEEYGLIGGSVILFVYLILLFRSIKIAQSCDRVFGSLLAIGISFSLVFQALINMAVAVNLFPVTGQPLPMVSMGGTSIWFTCIAVGVILSVSRGVEEDQKLKEGGVNAVA